MDLIQRPDGKLNGGFCKPYVKYSHTGNYAIDMVNSAILHERKRYEHGLIPNPIKRVYVKRSIFEQYINFLLKSEKCSEEIRIAILSGEVPITFEGVEVCKTITHVTKGIYYDYYLPDGQNKHLFLEKEIHE